MIQEVPPATTIITIVDVQNYLSMVFKVNTIIHRINRLQQTSTLYITPTYWLQWVKGIPLDPTPVPVYTINKSRHYCNSCCDLLLLYAILIGFDIISLLTITYTIPMRSQRSKLHLSKYSSAHSKEKIILHNNPKEQLGIIGIQPEYVLYIESKQWKETAYKETRICPPH
jgi:hypothetical protein